MLKKLKEQFVNLLKQRQKELTKLEKMDLLLSTVPESKQTRAKSLARRLKHPEKYGSISDYYFDHNEYNNILSGALETVKKSPKLHRKFTKDSSQAADENWINDYTPEGLTLYNHFRNPFAMYAYIAKNHPTVARCIEIIREEIASDGYHLKYAKAVKKRELKEASKILKKLKVPELRLNIVSHLKTYGNAWLIEVKDENVKKKTLELLSPVRIIPVVDQQTQKIVFWDYYRGYKKTRYKLNEVYHLYLSNVDSYKQLGDPCLQAALTDIETDLALKNYDREVMEKGVLGSFIFSMEDPPEGDPLGDDSDDIVANWEDRVDDQIVGAAAGGSPIVMTGLKDATALVPIGTYGDGTTKLSKEKSKIICTSMGVPPEKINLSRDEAKQYIPGVVEYSINVAFDKSIFYVLNIVDEFLNDVFIQELLKYENLRIQAGGRFGSLTKTAAEVIKILAEAGPIITVNQALELILGWEGLPPENPRGRYVLDVSIGRKVDSLPLTSDPEKEDLEFATNDPVGRKKKVSFDQFLSYVDDIKTQKSFQEGQYEKKEVSHLGDDEFVSSVHCRLGGERYFIEKVYN